MGIRPSIIIVLGMDMPNTYGELCRGLKAYTSVIASKSRTRNGSMSHSSRTSHLFSEQVRGLHAAVDQQSAGSHDQGQLLDGET
jgi:hypothetical protein